MGVEGKKVQGRSGRNVALFGMKWTLGLDHSLTVTTSAFSLKCSWRYVQEDHNESDARRRPRLTLFAFKAGQVTARKEK